MDPHPPLVEPALPEAPGRPPVATWRKILWSLFAITVVAPVAWLLGLVVTGTLLMRFLPHADTMLLLVPSFGALAVVWPVLRSGLRRDWPARRGQLIGWGIGAAVSLILVGLATAAYIKVRDSSKLKAMIPRQPAAAIDQFYLENPYRIFLKYDEIVGPDKYIKAYNAVDGEDLRAQFPIRTAWSELLPVRLPDGTTVRRLEVLAAIGQSGLIATYPQPQDDHYDPRRVYRLDCGVSFRGWHVVNLPPDPAGREGRDQDGVHTYQFPDGRHFEITYRSGVPDGPFRAYHADGTPWGEATYRNGRVVEAWLITRDGRKIDELKDGEAAQKAVTDSLAAASLGARESGLQKLHAQDYTGAIVDLTRALAINPLDADLHRARGDAYRANGNLDGAIEDYGAAEGFTPEQLGDYRMPEPLRSVVLARGRQRQQAGDTAGATRDFAAIGKDAGWAAEEMLRNHDYAGAIRMLDPAIAAAPVAELYAARAEARWMLPGQQVAAEGDYTQAIELALRGKMQIPSNQRVLPAHWLYQRGQVRRLLGNLAGAAEDFRAALPGLGTSALIQQTDAAFWLFLVQCEQGRKPDAIAELARTDQSGWMEWNRQFARFLLGESTEAQLDEYVAANRNDDILFRASFFSAMLRRFAGDNAGALVRFQQAFKHSTYDDFAHDEALRSIAQATRQRGEQKLHAGDFAGAHADFGEALFLLDPDPADLIALYGDAKRGLKDPEGALANYQNARRVATNVADDALRRVLDEKISALTTELAPVRQAKEAAKREAAARRAAAGVRPMSAAQQAARQSAQRPVIRAAEQKLRSGDATGAIATLDPVLAAQGADAALLHLRADAHRTLGQLDRALADYTLAMDLSGDSLDRSIIQYKRGHVHRLQGDLPAAAADIRPLAQYNYISRRPDCTDASFWLFFIECDLGHKEPATTELAQRFARDGQSRWNEVDWLVAEFLLGHIDEKQLVASAMKSRFLAFSLKAPFFNAMLRQRAGDAAGALELFRQALTSRILTMNRDYEIEAEEASRAVQKLNQLAETPAAR